MGEHSLNGQVPTVFGALTARDDQRGLLRRLRDVRERLDSPPPSLRLWARRIFRLRS